MTFYLHLNILDVNCIGRGLHENKTCDQSHSIFSNFLILCKSVLQYLWNTILNDFFCLQWFKSSGIRITVSYISLTKPKDFNDDV